MDSEEDISADNRELAHGYASTDEESIPALIPIVERRPFFVLPRAHEHGDPNDMPALMSVSDSSDDADVSSFHYNSGENVESDREDEEGLDSEDFEELDEEDFDEYLSPLPQTHEDAAESDEEEQEFLTSHPYPTEFSQMFPSLSDDSWLSRPHLRSRRSVPDYLIPEGLFTLGPTFPEMPVAPPESDLDRAKVLVDGLERVSGGLLERMLRVGGAPGAYEDVSEGGKTVCGCAICWETLLDKNISEADPSNDVPPFAHENHKNEIICLPCAHVFHSSCLIPWLSQKTSCPTCRFNIDPDSLTQSSRHPTRNQDNNQQLATSANSSPIRIEVRYLNDIYHLHDPIEDLLGFDDQLLENDDFDQFFDELQAEDNHFETSAPSRSLLSNRSWTRPDAPGKSLRESIEEKEREMGLRCLDPMCIFAPTDEDPQAATTTVLRQILIKVATVTTCMHAVHPACLVRSARADGWKAVRYGINPHHGDFSIAEVLCPSCRATGTLSRKDWEEGIIALAKK